MTAADTIQADSPDLVKAEARRLRAFAWVMWSIVLWHIAMLAVRLVWGQVADHRLQAEIDRIHSVGEPVFPEDFAPTTSLPDEANAAMIYQQAAAALIQKNGKTISFNDFLEDLRCSAAYPDDARLIVEANASTLKLLRQARDVPGVDWGVHQTSPMMNMLLPYLSTQRGLAKFAAAAAVCRHRNGDSAAAIEILHDTLVLAGKLDDGYSSSVITHLTAGGIDGTATLGLEATTPTLPLTIAEENEAKKEGPAGRRQVDTIVALLLDEEQLRRNLLRSLYAERAAQLDSVNQLCYGGTLNPNAPSGGGGVSLQGYLALSLGDPLFKLVACRLLQDMTQRTKAGLASDWEQARIATSTIEVPAHRGRIAAIPHLIGDLLAPSLDHVMIRHFRNLALRRMAALALAIRLYELDHGHRPERLDDLVPQYLVVLPPDPFAGDGQTFGYRPDVSPPILYSIGDDGLDDGGEYAIKDGIVDNGQKDMPFFLNGDRPHPPLKPSLSGG